MCAKTHFRHLILERLFRRNDEIVHRQHLLRTDNLHRLPQGMLERTVKDRCTATREAHRRRAIQRYTFCSLIMEVTHDVVGLVIVVRPEGHASAIPPQVAKAPQRFHGPLHANVIEVLGEGHGERGNHTADSTERPGVGDRFVHVRCPLIMHKHGSIHQLHASTAACIHDSPCVSRICRQRLLAQHVFVVASSLQNPLLPQTSWQRYVQHLHLRVRHNLLVR
mmetsp:Transcript_6107/g.17093  ORF Transcript_6107/g.17093 Transcript_6107/m.17093 type:complete len:222 (-) Transcript_6107:238-903(-)